MQTKSTCILIYIYFLLKLLYTGIWLHESGVLGASPDGFVQGDFNANETVHPQVLDQPVLSPDIVEVKCPFTARDMTIREACQSNKDFFLGKSFF